MLHIVAMTKVLDAVVGMKQDDGHDEHEHEEPRGKKG